jgi:hypothetical protein
MVYQNPLKFDFNPNNLAYLGNLHDQYDAFVLSVLAGQLCLLEKAALAFELLILADIPA